MHIPTNYDRFSPSANRHDATLAKLNRQAPARDTGPSFKILEAMNRRPDELDERQDQQAASLLVSQLFVMPMLAEARKFPLGGEVGHGGRGEEVFGEQLDQILSDRIAARMPGLTDELRARFARTRERKVEATQARQIEAAQAHTRWEAQQLRETTGQQLEVSA